MFLIWPPFVATAAITIATSWENRFDSFFFPSIVDEFHFNENFCRYPIRYVMNDRKMAGGILAATENARFVNINSHWNAFYAYFNWKWRWLD